MKKITLFLSILLVGAIIFAVVGNKELTPENPKSERREVRENRRAERQAAMERQIDSIMIAKTWIFTPHTIQQEPAGRMQILTNPQFEVRVWDGSADVFLPYIAGVTPPYKKRIINYTIPMLNDYAAIQTEDGWAVSFNTTLFSASTYTFKFEVNAKFGTTTLTLSNVWNSDVTYTGSITPIY